jgi:hypothetical protein
MMQVGASEPLSPEEAARQMSELLKRELDMEVSPERIVALFGRRWASLSRLGHAIHQKEKQR